MMVSYRVLIQRRWRLAALIAACVAVGALVAGLLLPQYFSNAGTTSVSTIYKTGKNLTNGSTASSNDSPSGNTTGTSKPGDTLQWVVSYQNNTTSPASVNITDKLTSAGAYVPGSLMVPPNQNGVGSLTPQYSTDGGTSWASGAPPANANGVGFTGTVVPQGTKQLSVNFPSPNSNVVSAAGGDAYNVVVRGNLIYAVYHHRGNPNVYCAQMNGTTCPGWPTGSNAQTWSPTNGAAIGTGTAFAGVSGWQGGTWLSGNRLYWLVGLSDNSSAGTACLDLSTTTPTSCGYTSLATKQLDNGNGASIGGTGLQASNGNRYVVTVTNGSNAILCINASGASCGALNLNSGVTYPNSVSSATFGDRVFTSVRQTSSSSWQTYCYVAGGSLCTGSWPVTTSTTAANGGTPFAPILSTTGTLTGVCTITNGTGTSSQCWDLAGKLLSNNPYSGVGANYNAVGNGAGDTFVRGAKVYGGTGNNVFCIDFGAYSGTGTVPNCSGFTRPSNNTNYTVRSATDVAPNCLVATGDAGIITFFNAITGGGCTGVTGPTTMTVNAPAYYCGSGASGFKGWGTFSLPGLVAGTYTNSTVTLRDQNNNVISGYNGVTLAVGGTLNLSPIPTSVTSITASVTVNGVNDPSGVASGQISITWQGNPPEMCFKTTAPPSACDAAGTFLSNYANAVTDSATGSDKPGGNQTGNVNFLNKADPSQCALSIKKTSGVQTVQPGGKVGYSVTVSNTGSQAYNSAAFTDDLTDLLKESTYNFDHAASTGTVSYTAPKVSWSGALAAGATATVTYSVTVNSPDDGDHSLVNTVVSPTTGSNCAQGSKDPNCTVTVAVKVIDAIWHKVDASTSANILTGAAWTFTPVDGSGKPTGPSIVVDDCVAAFASLCTGADRDPIGGIFRLTDLGPGTYQLVETQAPIGFKLSTKPIPVTLAAGSTTINLPDVVNAQLPVPAIPFTGGLGTDALTFSALGVFAVALGLGAWQLIRRRRKV